MARKPATVSTDPAAIVVEAETKVVSIDPLPGSGQVPEGGKEGGAMPASTGTTEEPAPGPSESTPVDPDQPRENHAQRVFLDEALGGFDPNLHVVGPDGQPVKNKDGTLQRKRGRKPGQQNTAQEKPPAQTPSPQPDTVPVGCKEMAQMFAAIFTTTMTKMVGDEWSPASREEMAGLQMATEKYLISIGGIQVSPLANLAIVYGSYAAARLAHENTRSKLSRFTGWVARKTAGLFSVFRR